MFLWSNYSFSSSEKRVSPLGGWGTLNIFNGTLGTLCHRKCLPEGGDASGFSHGLMATQLDVSIGPTAVLKKQPVDISYPVYPNVLYI